MIREHIEREMHWFYPWLRKTAQRLLHRERSGHTLEPTALANEVLVKMMTWKGEIQVDDVDNLQRIATIVARRTLVDSGRRRQLRNDLQRSLNDAFPSAQYESVNGKSDQIQIALDKLGEIDPKLVRLVELICVESYGLKEASEVLEWSERTTARRWSFAKSWLANAIAD